MVMMIAKRLVRISTAWYKNDWRLRFNPTTQDHGDYYMSVALGEATINNIITSSLPGGW